MSMSVLERICSERDEVRSAAIALAESEDFKSDDKTFLELQSRAAELDKRAATLAELMDARENADRLDSKLSKVQRRSEERASRPETRESWGEQFTRSDVFTGYSGRGTSSRFEVEMRALPHALTSMGDALSASPVYDLTPPVAPPLFVPLSNVITVSQNSVDYISWKLKAGSAAVVPEGSKKPELEWEPSVTSASLDTIAGVTSYTRQLAQDAAAVKSYIDGELQREVSRKIESEARAAVSDATYETVTGPAGTGVSGAVRAGQAAVQAAGYSANGFLISSDDLVEMDLASMSLFRGDPRWGLTAIVDPSMDAGDPIVVGDFKAGVQHYQRTSVQLFLTDSHADHFVYNILDAVAEARVKTVVTKPAAIVTATAGA